MWVRWPKEQEVAGAQGDCRECWKLLSWGTAQRSEEIKGERKVRGMNIEM